MIKHIIISSLTFSSVIILLAFLLYGCKNKDLNQALSVNTAYNYISDGVNEKYGNIPLYFTNDNIYTEHDILSYFAITNEEETKIMAFDVLEIVKYNQSYYHEVLFNTYVYKIIIPLVTNDFFIEEAYLKMISNGLEVKFYLGEFNLWYEPTLGSPTNISINVLEGINEEIPFQTLTGLMLSIENKTNQNIKINQIKIDQKYVFIEDIYSVDDLDLSSIKEVDESYAPISLYNYQDDLLIDLITYSEIKFVASVKYTKYMVIYQAPIIIDYEINNISYKYVFDSFTFFSNNYIIPSIEEVCNLYDVSGI